MTRRGNKEPVMRLRMTGFPFTNHQPPITNYESHSWSRPFFAQTTRSIWTQYTNYEINEQPDHRDLEREESKPDEQADDPGQNSENKTQCNQTEHGEQPDHENCAEHAASLPIVERPTITERSYAAPLARVSLPFLRTRAVRATPRTCLTLSSSATE